MIKKLLTLSLISTTFQSFSMNEPQQEEISKLISILYQQVQADRATVYKLIEKYPILSTIGEQMIKGINNYFSDEMTKLRK